MILPRHGGTSNSRAVQNALDVFTRKLGPHREFHQVDEAILVNEDTLSSEEIPEIDNDIELNTLETLHALRMEALDEAEKSFKKSDTDKTTSVNWNLDSSDNLVHSASQSEEAEGFIHNTIGGDTLPQTAGSEESKNESDGQEGLHLMQAGSNL